MRSMLRALALGVALSTPVVSSATTLLPLDVEGLVDRSERVVLARVEDLRVEVRDTPEGRVVETHVSLWVEATFLGATTPRRVELVQRGGTAVVSGRQVEHRVHGAARFERGQRAVVFLERSDAGQLVVTGMRLGLRPVLDGANGPMVPAPDLAGVEFMVPGGAGARGAVAPAPAPAAETLARLVARIRAAGAHRVVTPQGRVKP